MKRETPARIAAVIPLVLVFGASSEARADEDVAPSPVLTAPPPAAVETTQNEAPPPRPAFGSAGTVVLDDAIGLGLGGGLGLVGPFGSGIGSPIVTGWLRFEDAKEEVAGRSVRLTTFGLAPSVDVFIAPRLSLGAQATLYRTTIRTDTESSATGGALRPRIGYVIPLGDGLAFWPRAFGVFSASHVENGGYPQLGGAVKSTSQTAIGWGFGGEGMLVASVGRFVALTLGPTLSYAKVDAVDDGPSALSRSGISFGVRGGVSLVL